MSDEKKNLKDEEMEKPAELSKELSSEELDKVSGGANNTSDYSQWQADLKASRFPNAYGATFEEWLELKKVRDEWTEYGLARCSCGSWKTRSREAILAGLFKCEECNKDFEAYSVKEWGAKWRSIYWRWA